MSITPKVQKGIVSTQALILDADSVLSYFKHCLCKNIAQCVYECFIEDSGCIELLLKFPVLHLPLTLNSVSLLFLPEKHQNFGENPSSPFSLHTCIYSVVYFFQSFSSQSIWKSWKVDDISKHLFKKKTKLKQKNVKSQ